MLRLIGVIGSELLETVGQVAYFKSNQKPERFKNIFN